MKKLFLIVLLAVFAALAVASVSEAGIISGLGKGVHVEDDVPGAHATEGVHLDKDVHTGKGVHLSDLYDAKGAHLTDHAHTEGDAGIEPGKKSPCKILLDCACFGCQKSDDAVAAFLSVAESYVPAQYMAPVRTFAIEYLPAALAFIYDDLDGDEPQKPPQH